MDDLHGTARERLLDLLRGYGFVPESRSSLAFARSVPDGSVQHIDIHDQPYLSRFVVDLQEVGRLSRRSILLDDLAGREGYVYGPKYVRIESAFEQIADDISSFAIPWFDGSSAGSPATEQIATAVKTENYRRHVTAAKDAFKREQYVDSIREFELAASFEPLDEVSGKFFKEAVRRAGGAR